MKIRVYCRTVAQGVQEYYLQAGKEGGPFQIETARGVMHRAVWIREYVWEGSEINASLRFPPVDLHRIFHEAWAFRSFPWDCGVRLQR